MKKMNLVERIVSKNIDDCSKIIKLYSVTMLNYRRPLGDKAWIAIEKIVGNKSAVSGFAFLLGMLSAKGMPETSKFESLIKEELLDEFRSGYGHKDQKRP